MAPPARLDGGSPRSRSWRERAPAAPPPAPATPPPRPPPLAQAAPAAAAAASAGSAVASAGALRGLVVDEVEGVVL